MDPELASECNQIAISNTLIKDNTFSKHVSYVIFGNDNMGTFGVQRRYKEFDALYTFLTSQWPGCYIPMIPHKKMIVN